MKAHIWTMNIMAMAIIGLGMLFVMKNLSDRTVKNENQKLYNKSVREGLELYRRPRLLTNEAGQIVEDSCLMCHGAGGTEFKGPTAKLVIEQAAFHGLRDEDAQKIAIYLKHQQTRKRK